MNRTLVWAAIIGLLLALVSGFVIRGHHPTTWTTRFMSDAIRSGPNYSMRSLSVIRTAYNPEPAQTDSSPCIGAWGDNLCELTRNGVNPIAVHVDSGLSRNSRVMIEGRVFRVLDHIPSRGVVDVFMFDRRDAIRMGRRRVVMWILDK